MDEIMKILNDLVDQVGFKKASDYLGETQVRNLQNWIRNNKVPDSKIGLVKKILTLKGLLR